MFLPLFPLSLVAFPGEELPLHIFEPRYRQLIAESVDNETTFGIPTLLQGGLAEHGTEVEVLKVLKHYDSGKSDVMTRGTAVFRIKNFQKNVDDKLYSGGEIEYQPYDPAVDNRQQDELLAVLEKIEKRLVQNLGLPDQLEHGLSFFLAPRIGLETLQKLKLLSLTDETQRQAYILPHLQRALHILEKQKAPSNHLSSNGGLNGDNGHTSIPPTAN